MKRDITVILLCFVAAATGANVQPILTGAGKLVFPETSPSANLSASAGALTVASGGTNKNITLTPSGSGFTQTPTLVIGDNIGAAGGSASTIGSTSAVSIFSIGQSAAARARLKWNYNVVPGSATFAIGTQAAVPMLLQDLGGNTGFAGAAGAYAVDVTGDINASGVFRKAGTAGVGTGLTVTVCSTVAAGPPATCSSSCTLIFTGGIRTGGTCS